MDWTSLIGPAVVAAVVSGVVTTIGFFINRSTSLTTHREKVKADEKLAERKFEFDKQLAERRFTLDTTLADRKRRQDLAEEVLAGFYQVGAIMQTVRSPMSYSSEAEGRHRPEGEPEGVGRQRDSYYAPLARLADLQEPIATLMSKRYRMAAWFGRDAEAPFQKLHEAISSVRTSASLLIQWSGQGVAEHDRALWRKLESDIWFGAEEPDSLAAKIDGAIAEAEQICRPALEGRAA